MKNSADSTKSLPKQSSYHFILYATGSVNNMRKILICYLD